MAHPRIILPLLIGLSAACSSDDTTARPCEEPAYEIGDGRPLVIQTVSEYNPDRPIAGVRVQVDDQAWLTTDAEGEVVFDPVASPYSVLVHQTIIGQVVEAEFVDVWSLRDQVSNPLIVRVDVGRDDVEMREASISGRISGMSGQADTTTRVNATEVGPDGTYTVDYGWDGASPRSVTLHALETDTASPPTRYLGHASRSVTIEAPLFGEPGSPAVIEGMDMTLGPVQEARVSGRFEIPEELASLSIPVRLALDFPDGTLWLGQEDLPAGQTTFDHVMPRIDGGEAWVSSYLGVWPGPFSWASGRVELPSNDVVFALPAAVTPLEPADGATIASDATFRWQPVAETGRYSLAVRCSGPDTDVPRQLLNFRDIETTATEVTLPAIPGLEVAPGSTCDWSVTWYPDATSNTCSERASRSIERTLVIE